MPETQGVPTTPPGWEGAADRLTRLVDPSGEALAWIVNEPGANCIGYAVRLRGEWVQLLDSGDPQALRDRPTRFGCPILFPFPGQVRGARYRWAGVEHTLAPLAPGMTEYGHGFAPRLPWRVARTGPASVEGEFHTAHDIPTAAIAAGYPFSVRLRLSVQLADRALSIALAATNEGEHPAPVGLGLHPYFAIGALGGQRTAVFVELPGRLQRLFHGNLPTGESRAVAASRVQLPPFGEMLHVLHTDLGAKSVAILRGQASDTSMRLSCDEGVQDLLLFAPPTENSVSVEPLSIAPGAASQPEGHPDGLWALAPGATRRMVVTIDVA